MSAVVYLITKHDDVSNLELEDGLVRQAAVALLEAPSTIGAVRIDLPRAETLAIGADSMLPTDLDALLTIEATSSADAQPSHLADLLVDVGTITSAAAVVTTVVAERQDSWVGSATRGITAHVLCNRGPGIDQSSYDAWRRDALKTCADQVEGVGIRDTTVHSELVAGAGFETHIEFSFREETILREAIADGTLAPIVGSELLDRGSLRTFTSSQHVLEPNENAWHAHDSADGEASR